MELEAQFYEIHDDNSVVCRLCPADCRLSEGQTGICRCRYNKNGKLYTDNYGEVVTLAVDPIEKKPLYHFYPSRDILSTGPNGCNLSCANCQNWTISQEKVQTTFVTPEQLVDTALKHDSIGVAFTYTEPIIWFEYIMATAPLLKEAGLKVVLVSNGYINSKPLEQLLGFVDAINVDLKSIQPDFYKKICKGKLHPVLDNIKTLAKSDCHLEITNLIIPGYNDSEDDLNGLVDFVASQSDKIPLHFSAYHTDYKLRAPGTPLETMLLAKEIAQAKLKFVYLGNIRSRSGSDTVCPNCGNLLIERNGYKTTLVGLEGSSCINCGFNTEIVN